MPAPRNLAAKLGSAGAVTLLVGTVMTYEGYVPFVYLDPVDRLAVCYGHDDQTLTLGKRYTEEECLALLEADLERHAAVVDCFPSNLTDGQKAAVVSFAYNVGVVAACNSTMARLANAGRPPTEWCAQLSRWIYSTKNGKRQILAGLVRRRETEMALCLEGSA